MGKRRLSPCYSCGNATASASGVCRGCTPKTSQPPPSMRRTSTERGYGQQHRQLRLKWLPFVAAGLVECHAETCLMPTRLINRDDHWDLGHTPDRKSWTGPEHRKCNRTDPQFRRGLKPRPGGGSSTQTSNESAVGSALLRPMPEQDQRVATQSEAAQRPW